MAILCIRVIWPSMFLVPSMAFVFRTMIRSGSHQSQQKELGDRPGIPVRYSLTTYHCCAIHVSQVVFVAGRQKSVIIMPGSATLDATSVSIRDLDSRPYCAVQGGIVGRQGWHRLRGDTHELSPPTHEACTKTADLQQLSCNTFVSGCAGCCLLGHK